MTLLALGLFAQGSAYALAQPPAATNAASHCGDMIAHEVSDESEGEDCCKDMRLDCVVLMSCMAPLHASDETQFAASVTGQEVLYGSVLKGPYLPSSGGPEPPPPQPFA